MGRLRGNFKKMKMLLKGIEGAVLAAGGAEAVVQVLSSQDVLNSLDRGEHIAVVLATAFAGFAIKALKNWLKNR